MARRLVLIWLLWGLNTLLLYAVAALPQEGSEGRVPFYLTAVVNHKVYKRALLYYYQAFDKTLWVSAVSLQQWGMVTLPKALSYRQINGQRWLNLLQLEGVHYRVDTAHLRVYVSAPARYFHQQTIGLAQHHSVKLASGSYAGFINFNLYSLYGEHQNQSANGLTTLGLLMPEGSLTQSVLIQPESLNPMQRFQEQAVLLNTRYRFDTPGSLTTYVVGNDNTGAAIWSGSVPFGGVKVYKNYAINPSIITFPQPNIIGNAALPSTVELSVDNVPISRQALESGAFQFDNVPVLSGYGVIQVTQTNILGESSVSFVPYFTSPRLLAKGLNTYSIDLGVLREDFGTRSFQYGQGLAVINYAQGVTNTFTAGVHGEVLPSQQTLGSTQSVIIGSGDGALSEAISQHNGHYGVLASLSYQYAQYLNAGASITVATPEFTDVSLENGSFAAPKYTFQAFINYPLNKHNRLQANYFQSQLRSRLTDPTLSDNLLQQRVSLAYYFSSYAHFNMGVNASWNLQDTHDWQVTASLQYTFSTQADISLNNAYQQTGNRYGISLQGSTTQERHGMNYQLSVNHDDKRNDTGLDGNVNWDNQYGDVSVFGHVSNHANHFAVRLASSIVFMDGNLYLTEPVNTSVALVTAKDLPNETIYFNNQSAGHTNAQGKLLIPNVVPYVNNTISIVPKDLPLNLSLAKDRINITPGYLRAVNVPFITKWEKTAVIELVNQKGKPLPMGEYASLTNLTGKPRYLIGYGGIVYVKDLPPNLRTLHGTIDSQQQSCDFHIALPKGYHNSTHEHVICEPSSTLSSQ